MYEIDIKYNYRLDSKCGDPDTDSPKLYESHQILWSKKTPTGKNLILKPSRKIYGRIVLDSNLTDNLSSDRMCPHFVGKYNGQFDDWLTKNDKENFQYKARTMGGHIVFPAHRKNGFTVNQARGVNRKIGDRFDLTLECIRRFYKNEESPLTDVLCRYSDFFLIFKDFKGYIDFFLLQDFIDTYEKVKFMLPFDNFKRSALPEDKEEYKNYMLNTIKLIDKRNNRILNKLSS